jgi:hypothetical protein
MPSLIPVVLCAALAVSFWTVIGFALASRLVPQRHLALAIAPAFGWAAFNAAALPILLWVGYGAATVGGLGALALVAALGSSARALRSRPGPDRASGVPWWAYAAAALLALACALAIVPKFADGGVLLAEPMYDHSKAAMIDDIARFGVPAGNPFFAEGDGPSHLAYYYLWHFGAALWSTVLGISAWEADIALTGVTAFASLSLMMGLAVWFSGRRAAAGLVVLLSAAASLRPVLDFALGHATLGALLIGSDGLEAWLIQATWVPQHLAAANSVVLAAILMARLDRLPAVLAVPVLALAVAAGFESSAWIGGVVFAAAAVPIGLALLVRTAPERRLGFLLKAAGAAVLAALLAVPFLRDEAAATAARQIGLPIAFHPYDIVGPILPAALGRVLDVPGFWLILLLVQLPAIYPAGTIAGLRLLSAPSPTRRVAAALALLAGAGLGIAWLFMSTIANNDLGWRAVLPGILVLTAFAAAGLEAWLRRRAWPAAIAVGLLLLGLPDGIRFVSWNIEGYHADAAVGLAASPALWDAVRRYTPPDERVADNPLYLRDAVIWPVNISWALFARRRSCFAGWDLARAYVALPVERLKRLDDQFQRVFAGTGSPEDLAALVRDYGCRTMVVTPHDGAWMRDGFAESPYYRKVEDEPGKWRIYRAVLP